MDISQEKKKKGERNMYKAHTQSVEEIKNLPAGEQLRRDDISSRDHTMADLS